MKVVRFILEICLAGGFGLLLIEAAMTVADPFISRGLYQYDRELGFRVRAHANGTNEFGFNASDFSHEKPVGVFRVLILSDSFNWAGGQEWNYTVLLQQRLDARYGRRRVEVINAGYPMTHTAEQLPLLRRFGLQYHPDLVVLGFFAGNDFFDGSPHRKRIVVNDTLIDIDPADEIVVFGYPIVPQSRFFAFVRQKWIVAKQLSPLRNFLEGIRHLTPWRTDATSAEVTPPTPAGTFPRETYLDIEDHRLQVFDSRTVRHDGEWAGNVDYILGALEHMAELCREHSVSFLVAIYPDEFQVDGALFAELVARRGDRADRYDLDMPSKILGPVLEARGVPWTDFRKGFQATQGGPFYVPNDSHWNRPGNELAADLLLGSLKPHLPEPHS
jgi:hypothetical protein